MPSAADATAFACANPQRPEAIAIEKPALTGTQYHPCRWSGAVCAYTEVVSNSISATTKKNFFVIFGTLLKNRSQEVVPVILLQPGSHWKSGMKPVLMFVRRSSRHVHHGQKHEYIC